MQGGKKRKRKEHHNQLGKEMGLGRKAREKVWGKGAYLRDRRRMLRKARGYQGDGALASARDGI